MECEECKFCKFIGNEFFCEYNKLWITVQQKLCIAYTPKK